MHLSDDKKTLLKVTNDDLENGEFIIPDTVTHIGQEAFRHCQSLTKVTIPNSVIHIGQEAFRHCQSLTKVTIPNSVIHIGPGAFTLCTSLTHVTIPDSVTHLYDNTFISCDLTHVTIPNSVKHIGNRVFYLCQKLTQVTIPNSVRHIGDYAFSNCTFLTQLTIPNSVTYIGINAFNFCGFLTQLTIPNSVIHIGEGAFYTCGGLTKVIIPNSVRHIGDYAFSNCSRITQVTIPTSVTHIGNKAFANCPNLQIIVIDDRIQDDYTRILNLLPKADQPRAKRWSDLKVAKETKQQALISVAALSMNGLTAHLLFKLLTQDGKIRGRTVGKTSFFQSFNHARQPALDIIHGVLHQHSIFVRPFPMCAEQMLMRLCDGLTVRFNPAVAQICLPASSQELDTLFGRVTRTALPHVRILPNPSQRNPASSVVEIEDATPKLSGSGR